MTALPQKICRISAPSLIELRQKMSALVEGRLLPCLDTDTQQYHISVAYSSMPSLRSEIQSRLTAEIMPKQSRKQPICFLFTGQGAQYEAMGKALYEIDICKASIDQSCDIIREFSGVDYLPYLIDYNAKIHSTQFTQPTMVLLETALYKLLQHLEVFGNYYIGHSVGEFAACVATGQLTLENALKLITYRANAMQALTIHGDGCVKADRGMLEAILEKQNIHLDFAAFNAPEQTVMSGNIQEIDLLIRACKAQNISARALTVSHPFHSQLMHPMSADFKQFCLSLPLQQAKLEPGKVLFSNLTGHAMQHAPDSNYWEQHVGAPVHFMQAVENAWKQSSRLFIEIGPEAVLCKLANKCIRENGAEGTFISCMTKSKPLTDTLLEALVHLDNAGHPVNWIKAITALKLPY